MHIEDIFFSSCFQIYKNIAIYIQYVYALARAKDTKFDTVATLYAMM